MTKPLFLAVAIAAASAFCAFAPAQAAPLPTTSAAIQDVAQAPTTTVAMRRHYHARPHHRIWHRPMARHHMRSHRHH